MIVFVADIANDCILGCDFLSKTGITESINKIFQNTPSTIDSNDDEQECCRIIEWAEELPDFFKDIFKDNSQNLDSSQKQKFAQLLISRIFSKMMMFRGSLSLLNIKLNLLILVLLNNRFVLFLFNYKQRLIR